MASTAICPACDESIILNAEPKLDQKVRCPHCRTDLIVVEVEPVELDWDDFEDDWDDDDDDWDDDDE
jgi:DNA-directed RNA polymerase subunit RPC12/RpoP